MLLHDVSDPFLESAKLNFYLGRQKVAWSRGEILALNPHTFTGAMRRVGRRFTVLRLCRGVHRDA